MKNFIGIITLLEFMKASVAIVNNQYPTPEVVRPCLYRYNPVCGSDGWTYFNRCILKYDNQDNIRNGLPPVYEVQDYCKECKCRIVNLPVCATDGTTYANECELDCVNRNRIKYGLSIINLAYRTRCLGPPCDCPTITSPVCGSDNVLYRNECELECASRNAITLRLPEIKVQNVGACQDGCSCPEIYQPVCGSDGRNYDNPCKVECQNTHLKGYKHNPVVPLYNGRCKECICDDIDDPICANNGTTFKNKCSFNCENERRYKSGQPALVELGRGKCISCVCEAIEDPVCGTDRNTYSSECVLKCENAAQLQTGGQGMSVWHKGKCENKTSDCVCNHCSDIYKPVCGDDHSTYWNYCWLKCYSDCNQVKGLKTIEVLKNEPCM